MERIARRSLSEAIESLLAHLATGLPFSAGRPRRRHSIELRIEADDLDGLLRRLDQVSRQLRLGARLSSGVLRESDGELDVVYLEDPDQTPEAYRDQSNRHSLP